MYKSKKEGMNDNGGEGEDGKITKMKSILRQIEPENMTAVNFENANKHITFEPFISKNANNNTPTNVKNCDEWWTANFINIWLQVKETIMWIYKLWIVPRIYALFRNIGPITERGTSVGIGRFS
jgi:hypothetical protein